MEKLGDIRNIKFWFSNGSIDNYVNAGIYKPGELRECDGRKYSLIVPLMMDMISACSVDKNQNFINIDDKFEDPYNKKAKGVTPFLVQVFEYSVITAKYPWKIFPFVAFNPHVPESLNICQYAIENLGFIGIKLYPAWGYWIDPLKHTIKNVTDLSYIRNDANFNYHDLDKHPDYNKINDVGKCILEFFKWADGKKLPITVHSQYASMQNINFDDEFTIKDFNNVEYWEGILRDFTNIRVNFGHFGGADFSKSCNENNLNCQIINKNCKHYVNNRCQKIDIGTIEEYSLDLIKQILKFAKNHPKRIFADVSAHDSSNPFFHIKDNKYSTQIRSILDSNTNLKLMYGTDTPVTANDQKFYESYSTKAGINYADYNNFYWYNALDFLFGQTREIPVSYREFILRMKDNFSFKKYDPDPKKFGWINDQYVIS